MRLLFKIGGSDYDVNVDFDPPPNLPDVVGFAAPLTGQLAVLGVVEDLVEVELSVGSVAVRVLAGEHDIQLFNATVVGVENLLESLERANAEEGRAVTREGDGFVGEVVGEDADGVDSGGRFGGENAAPEPPPPEDREVLRLDLELHSELAGEGGEVESGGGLARERHVLVAEGEEN